MNAKILVGIFVIFFLLGALTMVEARSLRNNNPGNIRFDPNNQWLGQVGVDPDGFVIFSSPYYGFRALSLIWLHYQTRDGLTTLTQMGNRYAPGTPGGYGKGLGEQLGVDPNAPFNVEQNLPALLRAIAVNEEGAAGRLFSSSDIQAGVKATLA
ncbi:MAG: structural protein P5 [Patescibacteria group bacterium]|nr:structural protein P5 [Patescibacteria group bacterium]